MASEKRTKQFFRNALDKMFKEVGFDGFDEEFVKQENWYQLKEWSEDQEREYRSWFIDECRKQLKVNKKTAELEVAYFLLMWGWKTKYIETGKKIPRNEEHKIDESI